MPRRLALAALALVAPLAGAAGLAFAQTAAPPATTPLKAADGKTIGEAGFRAANGGVLIDVKVSGLTPGWHGMHLHAVGDCSDAKFEKAGGHINHAGDHKMAHGLLNPDGPDFGDLPNIYVAADGTGQAQAFTTLVSWNTTAQGAHMGLKDADGSAIVIHAAPDDQRSQPIGGAGDRVACGVIK
ncbi:MAG: superoxide dismutase [Caulobacterales bacterium 68-7]|nr:superoxide dismutase family protein [Caulobacterales bacterium]OJU08081.1 MAG: superoxide dismutase [Caulobacterales bacterium 68-7]